MKQLPLSRSPARTATVSPVVRSDALTGPRRRTDSRAHHVLSSLDVAGAAGAEVALHPRHARPDAGHRPLPGGVLSGAAAVRVVHRRVCRGGGRRVLQWPRPVPPLPLGPLPLCRCDVRGLVGFSCVPLCCCFLLCFCVVVFFSAFVLSFSSLLCPLCRRELARCDSVPVVFVSFSIHFVASMYDYVMRVFYGVFFLFFSALSTLLLRCTTM